ncbi:hypothetical protein [Nocardioides pacificus]
MLRRFLALLAILGSLVVVVAAAVPSAVAGCVVDKATGEVDCEEEDGGNPGGNSGGGEATGGFSTCMFGDTEIQCSRGGGSWSSEHMCYIVSTPVSPQPDPPAGQSDKDGDWHPCIQAPPYQGSNQNAWVETGEVLVNPEDLARRAIASMDLDPVKIGIVPEPGQDRVGLVGLPVWMWVEDPTDDTFGPITASASEGPVSVSATARVSSIVWDMGDGTKVTCTGRGTPYADHYGKQDSPTCGHRYEQMSDDKPHGAYPVTATSHWVVEWTGGGQSGSIEFDLTTAPLPIRIGEAQALTQ